MRWATAAVENSTTERWASTGVCRLSSVTWSMDECTTGLGHVGGVPVGFPFVGHSFLFRSSVFCLGLVTSSVHGPHHSQGCSIGADLLGTRFVFLGISQSGKCKSKHDVWPHATFRASGTARGPPTSVVNFPIRVSHGTKVLLW